jgi:hypothetical protein
MLLAQVGGLHAASARILRGVPLAITWPLTITVSLSASVNTASMSCSTSRMPWFFLRPAAGRPCARLRPRAHAGQRLVEQQHLRLGGQRHGDFELALFAVADGAGDAALAVCRPASSSARSARALTAAKFVARLSQRAACGARDCAASRTFSQTLKGRKMLVFW